MGNESEEPLAVFLAQTDVFEHRHLSLRMHGLVSAAAMQTRSDVRKVKME